jgi:hypothetical protein
LTPSGQAGLVLPHPQVEAAARDERVAELVHGAELPRGVDVEQRERQRRGRERLLGQPHQHRRVLADRVQHHRPLELGHHLAQHVEALGLELAQVREARRRGRRVVQAVGSDRGHLL